MNRAARQSKILTSSQQFPDVVTSNHISRTERRDNNPATADIQHLYFGRIIFVCMSLTGIIMILTGVGITSFKLQAGFNIVSSLKRNMQQMFVTGDVLSTANSANIPNRFQNAPYVIKRKPSLRNSYSGGGSAEEKIKTCRSSVCLWVQSYLKDKLNVSINPCTDFYGYVCSSARWFNAKTDPDQRAHSDRAIGAMMKDIERFFRDYLNQNEERYHKYPGVFLHQAIGLLAKCQSSDKLDKNLTILKQFLVGYNLDRWPFRKAPSGLDLVAIAGYIDRDLGIFPFGTVRLVKVFEDDRSYTTHLMKPTTLYQRHQLAFPQENDYNYTQRVAIALSLFDSRSDVWELAEDIVQLEKTFVESMPTAEFVDFQDRMKHLSQFKFKKVDRWDWIHYLKIIFQDIEHFDEERSIVIPDFEYLTRITAIINQTSLTTLVNYVGYRLVVEISPLLHSVAEPLLPLSFDNYHTGISERFQACVHLIERVWPQGMRYFARMTYSKGNASLVVKTYDREMQTIETRLKSAISDRLLSASSWLDRSAIGVGVDKTENLHIIFFGSDEDVNAVANYYSFNTQQFDPTKLLDSYKSLKGGSQNLYWMSKPPKDDLDARFHHSTLSFGYEVQLGRNLLFIPHADVAFANGISTSLSPLLYPLFVPDVIRGMFQIVDSRGAHIDQNLAVSYWWNAEEKSKFEQIKICFQDQYYIEYRDIAGDNIDPRTMILDNIADNAVISPLHNVFFKALLDGGYDVQNFRFSTDSGDIDLQKLFFILYAAGLCEKNHPELERRKLKFEQVPHRLRVNIPLQNSPEFAKAYNCPVGSVMNPNRKCTLW